MENVFIQLSDNVYISISVFLVQGHICHLYVKLYKYTYEKCMLCDDLNAVCYV